MFRYDSYVSNMNVQNSKSFDFLLIATLRAILDSKYANFVYNADNIEMNSQFTDYVYYWLGQYTVCDKTRKIIKYEVHNDEDNNRLW